MTTNKSNAAPDPQPAEPSFDVEAMLTACVPGGRIVDPQVVADNIRAWVADHKPAELAEQQGGALTMIGSNLRSILDLASKMGGGAYQITVANIQHETNHALELLEAALTARQPGAQEPITVEAVATVRRSGEGDRYIYWLTEGGIADLEAGDVLMVSDRAITNHDGSGEVYAAPPAQGIDLGQFRTQVAELLRMEFDLEVADPEDHRHDDGASEAERIASKIAALIDQRDAAPGVGNG